MESNKRLSELLVQTGAFTDLPKPTILASGALGIYYCNTEKLCQDNGEFNNYGDAAGAMILHAMRMRMEHPTFNEAIGILADATLPLLGTNRPCAIAGGQRRDWLFSGPIAAQLGVAHVALYKQETGKPDRIEVQHVHQSQVTAVRMDVRDMRGLYVIHWADLLTEASSCYDDKVQPPKGWVPMLRTTGMTIEHLGAVVSRQQGGEARLAAQGVNAHPQIFIDADFLSAHSKFPARALEYQRDPKVWEQAYLREHGATEFVDIFNPAGKKLDKAKALVLRSKGFLEANGKWEELEAAVRSAYGKPIAEIIGGSK